MAVPNECSMSSIQGLFSFIGIDYNSDNMQYNMKFPMLQIRYNLYRYKTIIIQFYTIVINI